MSTGPWPRHTAAYWNEALDHARAHGWVFEKRSGHAFGQLSCPAGSCPKVAVFSTGKGSESVARQTIVKVDRCPHGAGAADALARASRSLDQAEALMQAADSLIAQRDASRELDRLGDPDDDEYDQKLGELFEAIDTCEAEIRELLDQAGVEQDSPRTLADLTDMAKVKTADAQEAIAEAPVGNAETKALKVRLAALKAHLRNLRKAVD